MPLTVKVELNHWTTGKSPKSLLVSQSLSISKCSLSPFLPAYLFPSLSLSGLFQLPSCCTASDPPLSFLPLFFSSHPSVCAHYIPFICPSVSHPHWISPWDLNACLKTLLSESFTTSLLAVNRRGLGEGKGPVIWGWGLRVLELGGPARWQGG